MQYIKDYSSLNINEAKTESFEEFSKVRLAGATKIADSAKEKGGDAMLTYHHFAVKLPTYKKASDGKFDLDKAKAEYKDLLDKLYSSTYKKMNITPVEFQELVGRIEVIGELIIRYERD
jgi:hypothetical protein